MFNRGDIVLSIPPYRPKVFIITEITRKGYSGIDPATGKGFRLGFDGLKKIGDALPDYMETSRTSLDNPTTSGAYMLGKRRAEHEKQFGVNEKDRERWGILAAAKPGDMLLLNGDKKVKFIHVLARGSRFVFLATDEAGKTYKYPLNSVALNY